ncbi:unnamed protein product [Lepidochelys olivacea]
MSALECQLWAYMGSHPRTMGSLQSSQSGTKNEKEGSNRRRRQTVRTMSVVLSMTAKVFVSWAFPRNVMGIPLCQGNLPPRSRKRPPCLISQPSMQNRLVFLLPFPPGTSLVCFTPCYPVVPSRPGLRSHAAPGGGAAGQGQGAMVTLSHSSMLPVLGSSGGWMGPQCNLGWPPGVSLSSLSWLPPGISAALPQHVPEAATCRGSLEGRLTAVSAVPTLRESSPGWMRACRAPVCHSRPLPGTAIGAEVMISP